MEAAARARREFFEKPLSTNGRRSSSAVRGYGQNSGLAQQSPAIFIGKRDAPEVAPVDAGYSVVTGELLIHESEVRCQQIDDTTVFFQLSIKEEIHLFRKGQPQVVIEPRKMLVGIRSKQENISGFSHCSKKFSTSAVRARGSASMRRTC